MDKIHEIDHVLTFQIIKFISQHAPFDEPRDSVKLGVWVNSNNNVERFMLAAQNQALCTWVI